MHDPRVGRFLSVDPLEREYAYNSPYSFSENRVIDGIELEGLERLYYGHYLDKQGNSHVKLVRSEDIIKERTVIKSFLGFNYASTEKYVDNSDTEIVVAFVREGYGMERLKSGAYRKGWYFREIGHREYGNDGSILTDHDALIKANTEEADNSEWKNSMLAGATLGSLYASAIRIKPVGAGSSAPRITLKEKTPQNGSQFETYGVTISNGKININGRTVTNGRYDFVITQKGELRIGTGHHNLSDGASTVSAAGRLKIHNGKVTRVNNDSGHYKPSAAETKAGLSELGKAGVNLNNAKVTIYGTETTTGKTVIQETFRLNN